MKQTRSEQTRQKQEGKPRKTRNRRQSTIRRLISVVAALIIIDGIAAFFIVRCSDMYYSNAASRFSTGEYQAAGDAYRAAGHYKDAAARARLCDAMISLQEGRPEEAAAGLEQLIEDGHKDITKQLADALLSVVADWKAKGLSPQTLLSLLDKADIIDPDGTLDVARLAEEGHAALLDGQQLAAYVNDVDGDGSQELIALNPDYSVTVYRMIEGANVRMAADNEIVAACGMIFGNKFKNTDVNASAACFSMAYDLLPNDDTRSALVKAYHLRSADYENAGKMDAAVADAQSAMKIAGTEEAFTFFYEVNLRNCRKGHDAAASIALWDAFAADSADELARFDAENRWRLDAAQLHTARALELAAQKDESCIAELQNAAEMGADIASAASEAASYFEPGLSLARLRLLETELLDNADARKQEIRLKMADEIRTAISEWKSRETAPEDVLLLISLAEQQKIDLSAVNQDVISEGIAAAVAENALQSSWVDWDSDGNRELFTLDAAGLLSLYGFEETWKAITTFDTGLQNPSCTIMDKTAPIIIVLSSEKNELWAIDGTNNHLVPLFHEEGISRCEIEGSVVRFSVQLEGSITRYKEYSYEAVNTANRPVITGIDWQENNYPLPADAAAAVRRYFESTAYGIPGETALLTGTPTNRWFTLDELNTLPSPDVPLSLDIAAVDRQAYCALFEVKYPADSQLFHTCISAEYNGGWLITGATDVKTRDKTFTEAKAAVGKQIEELKTEDLNAAVSDLKDIQKLYPAEEEKKQEISELIGTAEKKIQVLEALALAKTEPEKAAQTLETLGEADRAEAVRKAARYNSAMDKMEKNDPEGALAILQEYEDDYEDTAAKKQQLEEMLKTRDESFEKAKATIEKQIDELKTEDLNAAVSNLKGIQKQYPAEGEKKQEISELIGTAEKKIKVLEALALAGTDSEKAAKALETLGEADRAEAVRKEALYNSAMDKMEKNDPEGALAILGNYEDEYMDTAAKKQQLEETLKTRDESFEKAKATIGKEPEVLEEEDLSEASAVLKEIQVLYPIGGEKREEIRELLNTAEHKTRVLKALADAEKDPDKAAKELETIGEPERAQRILNEKEFQEAFSLAGDENNTESIKQGIKRLTALQDKEYRAEECRKQIEKGNVRLDYLEAKDLLEKGAYTEAAEKFDLVAQNKDHAWDAATRANEARARAYLEEEKYKEAVDLLKKADSMDANIQELMATASAGLDRAEKAFSDDSSETGLSGTIDAHEYTELEPNNTQEKATPFIRNGKYHGMLFASNDIDYYLLEFEHNSSVNIIFESEGNSKNTTAYIVALMSLDSNEVFTGIPVMGNVNRTETGKMYLSSGSYLVQVTKGNTYTDGEYQLTVTAEQENHAEAEPNGSAERANEIPLNQDIRASIGQEGDVDYYSFILAEDAAVQPRFEFEPTDSNEKTYVMTIMDSNRRTLHKENFGGKEFLKAVTPVVLPAGTYIVRIENPRFVRQEYTLQLVGTAVAYAEREPNDSASLSTTLEMNQPCTGVLNTEEDMDYYNVTFTEKTEADLIFRFSEAKTTVTTFIITIEADGKVLKPFKAKGKSGGLDEHITIEAGEYSVRVSPAEWSNSIYTILISNMQGGLNE